MEESGDEIKAVYIPANIIRRKKIWLVLAEIAVYIAVLYGVLSMIPFVFKVKCIVFLVVGIAGSYLFFVGIKNRTVTEIIIAFIRFRQKRRILHLRSIKYARAESKLKNREFNGMSFFEKVCAIGKEKIRELAAKGKRE